MGSNKVPSTNVGKLDMRTQKDKVRLALYHENKIKLVQRPKVESKNHKIHKNQKIQELIFVILELILVFLNMTQTVDNKI